MKTSNAISKNRGPLGDEWETPWPLFRRIEKKLGVTFTLDVCATKRNAKCEKFFALPFIKRTRMNGLMGKWWLKGDPAVAFCNPPFSNISAWLCKAEQEARLSDVMSAVLLRADTSTKYFHKYAPLAHDVAFLTPRVNYIPPPGVSASSNSMGSVVLVFRPNRKKNHKPKLHLWKWK